MATLLNLTNLKSRQRSGKMFQKFLEKISQKIFGNKYRLFQEMGVKEKSKVDLDLLKKIDERFGVRSSYYWELFTRGSIDLGDLDSLVPETRSFIVFKVGESLPQVFLGNEKDLKKFKPEVFQTKRVFGKISIPIAVRSPKISFGEVRKWQENLRNYSPKNSGCYRSFQDEHDYNEKDEDLAPSWIEGRLS